MKNLSICSIFFIAKVFRGGDDSGGGYTTGPSYSGRGLDSGGGSTGPYSTKSPKGKKSLKQRIKEWIAKVIFKSAGDK